MTYLIVNSFGGLAMGYPATLMADNQMLQMSGMRGFPDYSSAAQTAIMMTCPAISVYKNPMPSFTCTFTNATDVVNYTAHGLANGTQVKFNEVPVVDDGTTLVASADHAMRPRANRT